MNAEARAAVLVYIGLGSNLNHPAEQIQSAFSLLAQMPETEFVARSSLYLSAPFGGVEQPDFVNAVAKFRTFLVAEVLLLQLQKIETSQGRVRGEHWGPRVLDLDLLLYGDYQINGPLLTVPHPGIRDRNFVLLPLREIDPELVIPGVARVKDIPVDESSAVISRML